MAPQTDAPLEHRGENDPEGQDDARAAQSPREQHEMSDRDHVWPDEEPPPLDDRDVPHEDDGGSESGSQKKKSMPVQVAVQQILASGALLKAADGGYFLRQVDGHWTSTRTRDAEGVVRRLCWQATRQVLSERQVREVLATAAAVAEGDRHITTDRVWVRAATGPDGRTVFVDLANDDGDVVEVSAERWRIVPVADAPVRFCGDGVGALPRPVAGGCFDELFDSINIQEDHRVLVAGFALNALVPHSDRVVLHLEGEQGAGKTTMARRLKGLLDPPGETMSPPTSEQNFLIAVQRCWLPAIDNLTKVPTALADTMCRIVSGTTSTTRALYTDQDQVKLTARRSIIVTSIGDVIDREDLADRTVTVRVPPLERAAGRSSDAEMESAFAEALPRILGVLFDGLVEAHRQSPRVAADLTWQRPRMASFAQWAVAGEAALGFKAGSFLSAFNAMRTVKEAQALESEPVAAALMAWAEDHPDGGRCLARDLLSDLTKLKGRLKIGRDWPTDAKSFRLRCKRVAPLLRRRGIDLTFTHSKKGAEVTVTVNQK